MLRNAGQLHYWNEQQALEVLQRALAVLADLEPPDDLRVAAFTKAADLLGQKHVVIEQVQLGAPTMAIPRGPS